MDSSKNQDENYYIGEWIDNACRNNIKIPIHHLQQKITKNKEIIMHANGKIFVKYKSKNGFNVAVL